MKYLVKTSIINVHHTIYKIYNQNNDLNYSQLRIIMFSLKFIS